LDIRIVVFDMDWVLVDIDSSWQFVHREFNVDNRENLRQFLNHEISYNEFMRKDIALWGKTNVDVIKNILAKVPLMAGANSTVAQLKKARCKTAIISAGISILAERIQHELEIDYVFANRIVVDENGALTGEGEEIVNPLNKIAVLKELVLMAHATSRQCAVVGDTVFDVPMFRDAGFSIAFNADDVQVKKAADAVIEDKDLTKILAYLLR